MDCLIPCDMISLNIVNTPLVVMSIVLGLVKARAPVFCCLCGVFLSPSFLGPLSEVPTLSAWARLSRALSITVDLELIVRIMQKSIHR